MSDEITEATLAELERLDRASGDHLRRIEEQTWRDVMDPGYAALFVAAVRALPALLAEVRRLRAARPAQEERTWKGSAAKVIAAARDFCAKGGGGGRYMALVRSLSELGPESAPPSGTTDCAACVCRWRRAPEAPAWRHDKGCPAYRPPPRLEDLTPEERDLVEWARPIMERADVPVPLDAAASGTTETGAREDRALDLLMDVWQQFALPVSRERAGVDGAAHDGGLSTLEDVAEHLVAAGRLVLCSETKDWYVLAASGERGDATRAPARCKSCGQNLIEGFHYAMLTGRPSDPGAETRTEGGDVEPFGTCDSPTEAGRLHRETGYCVNWIPARPGDATTKGSTDA